MTNFIDWQRGDELQKNNYELWPMFCSRKTLEDTRGRDFAAVARQLAREAFANAGVKCEERKP